MTPPDPRTPDEIEQRQRPDGTVESDTPRRRTEDAPLSPDQIEQRQSVTPDEDDGFEDVEGPLDPDEIEQRLAVGGDDEEPGPDQG